MSAQCLETLTHAQRVTWNVRRIALGQPWTWVETWVSAGFADAPSLRMLLECMPATIPLDGSACVEEWAEDFDPRSTLISEL